MSVNCTNIIFDSERGEYICADTGEVIQDHVPNPLGVRIIDHDDWFKKAHSSRVSNKVHDGLFTEIDVMAVKGDARKMAGKLRKLHRALRVITASHGKKEIEAYTLMNRACAVLGLSELVKETAGKILKKIVKKLDLKSNKIRGYVAVAIVEAARKHNIPIRPKDVVKVLEIDEKTYWKIKAEVSFKLGHELSLAVPDARQFVPKIVSKLDLSSEVETLAIMIVDMLKRRGYTEGKEPAGVAAAATYIASIVLNEKRTQREIAEAAGVTEVTVRNRYRDIIDKLVIEVLV